MRYRVLISLLLLLCLSQLDGKERMDSLSVEAGRGTERIFMPKGDLSAGAQFFCLDFSGSDSEFLLLLQHLDARGSIMSFSPYFSWCYADNRAVGLRAGYSSASGEVSNADLSMLTDDLSLSVNDLRADSRTIRSELFHRTYVPLDARGRFGLFADLSLSWSHGNTSFSGDAGTMDTTASSDKLRISVHPGIMVFILNNLSTHISIGAGGAGYTHIDYLKDGESVGTRKFAKVNFMPDIFDISYGLSLHF